MCFESGDHQNAVPRSSSSGYTQSSSPLSSVGPPSNVRRGDFAGCDVEAVEIMAAAERHAGGVGRKLGIAFSFGRGGELLPLAGIDGEEEQIALNAQKHLFA